MLTRKQLTVVLKLDLYSSLFFLLGRWSPNDSYEAYFAGFVWSQLCSNLKRHKTTLLTIRKDAKCNGNPVGVRARQEKGRFRDVKRCVATGDRTWVSGIDLLRHNRKTIAAQHHRKAPQGFSRVPGYRVTLSSSPALVPHSSLQTSLCH